MAKAVKNIVLACLLWMVAASTVVAQNNLCGEIRGCREIRRIPAGVDSEGFALTVVELGFRPVSEAARTHKCAPDKRYVLLKSRDGKPSGAQTVVTVCQEDPEDPHPFETTVNIGKNVLSVRRDGGAFAGIMTQDYQLSPWLPRSVGFCEVDGTGEWRAEDWDWRKMRGVFFTGNSESGEICSDAPTAIANLIVPTVALDAASLENSKAQLGSCAVTFDASGKNGFVTYGKADPQDKLQIKLLRTSDRTLIAQVIDPQRSFQSAQQPAKSWIFADHFEIWQGPGEVPNSRTGKIVQALDPNAAGQPSDEPFQFGIPVDEASIQIGRGRPKQLPSVRRWTARLADGRTAYLLRIELAPPQSTFDTGFTVVYSQGLDGRAQKCLISTNRSRRGSGSERQFALAAGAAGGYVACGVVNGALEITGARLPALELSRGALGWPPVQ